MKQYVIRIGLSIFSIIIIIIMVIITIKSSVLGK